MKKVTKKDKIFDYILAEGPSKYMDIIKFAYELDGDTFDKFENRGYYSGFFRSGNGYWGTHLQPEFKSNFSPNTRNPRYLIKLPTGLYTVGCEKGRENEVPGNTYYKRTVVDKVMGFDIDNSIGFMGIGTKNEDPSPATITKMFGVEDVNTDDYFTADNAIDLTKKANIKMDLEDITQLIKARAMEGYNVLYYSDSAKLTMLSSELIRRGFKIFNNTTITW